MYRIASSLQCNFKAIKCKTNTSFNGIKFLLSSIFSSSLCGCCCAPFLNFFRFYRLLFYFAIYICVYKLTRSNILHWWIVDRVALSSFPLSFCLSWTWYCCLFQHQQWYTFVLIVMWEVNKSPMTCILPYWYIIFVCYATSSPITLRPFHIKT